MQNKQPEWLDKKEYPFLSRFMKIGNVHLHYIDEGEGEILLFVHGTPSWSFDFRKLVQNLSSSCRCIAPDHIGFGLSDKPAEYDYDIRNHASNLELFIKTMQLKNITLVVHDFGGPIAFPYAVTYPDNIKNIIVLNSWLFDFSHLPAFKAFKRLAESPLLPLLYKQFNFSARVLLPRSFGKRKIKRRTLSQYTRPFARPSDRLGCLAFARSLVKDQDWFQQLWEQRNVLTGKKIWFIWGMADRFITPFFLQKFSEGFPGSQVKRLEDCGHFPQEEAPEEVLTAIRSFLQHQNMARDCRPSGIIDHQNII